MLVSADLAMYDAKEDGRNRWAMSSIGDARDRRRTRSRVSWVERIERALEGDDFELFAQPIVDLRSGSTSQYELLLRMRESDGALTLPGDFLAVAERLDLIQGIDRWVTTRAIDLLADHQRGGRDLSIEINLSGRSLNDPGLLDLISHRIDSSGVDPHGLIFEVTETAAVSDIAAARNLAHSLADIGCRFALDDFGAGFGSFYYLKYLPFDFLKIDGEFVSNCTSNDTDKTIIRALVNVARQLGKQTIAEFTGDAATLRFLRKEGVDHAQGYHVGRPLPLSQALGPIILPFVERRAEEPTLRRAGAQR
jgi:EAL domain-containing protein (putative c-di-GMP-specific phosphodiesterase class I)